MLLHFKEKNESSSQVHGTLERCHHAFCPFLLFTHFVFIGLLFSFKCMHLDRLLIHCCKREFQSFWFLIFHSTYPQSYSIFHVCFLCYFSRCALRKKGCAYSFCGDLLVSAGCLCCRLWFMVSQSAGPYAFCFMFRPFSLNWFFTCFNNVLA